MEEKIENYVENGLESVSSILYFLSIVAGVILIVVGFWLNYKSKHAHQGKKKTVGTICVGIGLLALISGLLQLI